MKYIGKWEVSAALSFVDGKIKWVTREEANSIEDFDLSLFSPIMEFAPDGTLNTLLFVPEEVREEAKKQGADIRENGYAVLESTVWKEEDGKFYYDTGIQGEVLGEKVDSFAEISLLPDDCLLYNLGTMILERA